MLIKRTMVDKEEKKSNTKKNVLFIVVVFLAFCFMYYQKDVDYSTPTQQEQIKEYATLQDAYNDHKNYIWNVCKEWLKLISPDADNFDWPTFAGEYQDKFIVKGTSDGVLFRCEYIKYDNKRGMNLNNVKREL